MTSAPPTNDATRKVRRPLHRLSEANLPIFDPPQDRSLSSLIRFLKNCKAEPMRPTTIAPDVPKLLTGAHMVQVGDPLRYLFELIVIRNANNQCFALYTPPPPDLRTLLPELNVVDLARSRVHLLHQDGREVLLSALTVDEVSHLIVLAQGPDQLEELEEELEDVEIVFEE